MRYEDTKKSRRSDLNDLSNSCFLVHVIWTRPQRHCTNLPIVLSRFAHTFRTRAACIVSRFARARSSVSHAQDFMGKGVYAYIVQCTCPHLLITLVRLSRQDLNSSCLCSTRWRRGLKRTRGPLQRSLSLLLRYLVVHCDSCLDRHFGANYRPIFVVIAYAIYQLNYETSGGRRRY